jgi:hypothetical protein
MATTMGSLFGTHMRVRGQVRRVCVIGILFVIVSWV